VTAGGGWPGDKTAETQLTALSLTEREVLAALAIVGHASLSADELAAVLPIKDIAPLLDDLDRRGLIRQQEDRRYTAAGRIGEAIRRTDAALASGDRLLKYMTTLAKGGSLTPERLVEDAQAILELSQWAAEAEAWVALLDLVKTLQACFSIADRVQQWVALLERGRSAAQALGDRQSEVWMVQQLATASASVGDADAAQRYLHEADQLQRGRRAGAPRRRGNDQTAAMRREAITAGGGGASRLTPWLVGLVLAAGAGAGTGYALGNGNDNVGLTTARISVTVTVRGRTVRTSDTVTLPATTVVTTQTELTTTTAVTTVTTTVAGIR
jgi:hypothetical protein